MRKPNNVRNGSVEEEVFWKLFGAVLDVERDVSLFAYRSSWRCEEVEGLTWEQIDTKEREAWLFDWKNGRRRVLPLEAELWVVIPRRQTARSFETAAGAAFSPVVFHRAGERLGDWRKTWASACEAAGVPGLLSTISGVWPCGT